MQNRPLRFILHRHFLLSLISVAVFALCTVLITHDARAQGTTNLLQNPGFDGPYKTVGTNESVAPSWQPWVVPHTKADPGYLLPPQFRLAQNTNRTRSGSTAQELFEVFAIYTGGVYQTVTVPANSTLHFSAFVNVWSTQLDDPDKSEQQSPVRVRVGIDPAGGADAKSATIVWSGDISYATDPSMYDQYKEYTVDAPVQETKATVFIEVSLNNPVSHTSFYFDDASLTAVGGASAGGSTPGTTAVAVVGTDTPTPTVDLTSSPTSGDNFGALTQTAAAALTATASDQFSGATQTVIALTSTPQPTGAGGFVPPTQEGTIIPPTPGGFVTVTPFTVASFTPIGGTGGNPTQSSGVTITPSGPALSGHIVYTVVSGDTLSDLAIRFNSDVDAIISANNLTADGLIVVGQNLVIPVPPTPTAAPIPPSQVPSGSPTAPIDGAALNGPTNNGVGTYIVQAGDTFAAIARHYNLTVQGLAQLNGIVNPNNVAIGTVLVVPGPGNNIPGGTIAPTSYPSPTVVVAPPAAKTYVVKPGDDLYRISLKFNVTIQALMRVNNLANPNVIYVGETLIIP